MSRASFAALRSVTAFSGLKLVRVLAGLEERGLIYCEQRGDMGGGSHAFSLAPKALVAHPELGRSRPRSGVRPKLVIRDGGLS